MNINSMVIKIQTFNEYIIDSGFNRDIQEYITTLSQPQNNQNIILLKEITTKVIQQLEIIINSDVPDILKLLIINEQIKIFLPHEHLEKFENLFADSQINAAQYYQKLNQLLSNLKADITANQTELNKVYNVIIPYFKKDVIDSEYATISFNFNDHDTISNLKSFYKALDKLNRALIIYHQLSTSRIPKDLELVNIQNGSIDVILNIDVNVALNLTEIIKYALIAFGGYLTYKKTSKQIVDTYLGNKKLIDSEKQREKLLLENIKETISSKLLEQHNKLLKVDNKINQESVPKKIEEVTKVFSEYIVKGNEVKLLIEFDESEDKEEDENKKNIARQKLVNETNNELLNVRNHLREMSPSEKKLLIDTYSITEEEVDQK